jgi:hypothetical protein
MLDLKPGIVREEMLDDQSLRAFGYLSRRCGRATQRLKIFLTNLFTNERNANPPELVT